MRWIRKWWGDPEPSSFFDYLDKPYQPPHWSARLVRVSARFVAREWKWFVATTIGVIGLVVKLF